jgi:hypothetical protein
MIFPNRILWRLLMCKDQCRDNRLFKPQGTAPPSCAADLDADLPNELRVSAQKLGAFAAANLAVFVDLGLSDDEIGRYFGLPSSRVSQLRQAWRIPERHPLEPLEKTCPAEDQRH